MIYPSNLSEWLTCGRPVQWHVERRASADQKAGHIVSTTTTALGICSTITLKETICQHMKMEINTKNQQRL